MQRQSHAIILKRTAYGEADWIVTFFDRDWGRVGGIAKSARSSTKRFGGALEPGTRVRIRYVARSADGLVRIDEAQVERGVLGAMKSLQRIQALARALELALAFLQERQAAPEKFDLLDERLMALTQDEPNLADALRFELEWLRFCGFGPELFGCTLCGRSASGGKAWLFDFDRGGVVCPSCVGGMGRHFKLSSGTLGSLQQARVPLEGDVQETASAAETVVARYIDHVLGRPLQVWKVDM